MVGTILMGKPKKGRTEAAGSEPEPTVQFNVRVPVRHAERLDRTARSLGTDRSHLIRMMIAEQLPVYEERARKAEGGGE
jgi:hypothetical protein